MAPALNPTLKTLLRLLNLDRQWTKAEGVFLTDADGRRFLDCYAQYGAVALGHNAPRIVSTVVDSLKAGVPAMIQPYRGRHAEELAERLTRLAPGPMAHCIFANSGAEAVEAAIKIVRARSGKRIILSADGSFHGKTMGALAVTGQRHYAERCGPSPPGFQRIPFGDAAALEARLESARGDFAALFLEPIQGERGVFLPPEGYLSAARQLCSRHGVALVIDEIQTGLGRTGRLFACESEGIAPDLILVAKALGGGIFPLGACLVRAEYWDNDIALTHSSTFANNNIACRVGLAVLDALRDDNLCAEATRKGDLLMNGLRALAARHPRMIAEVRGRGLLAAIQLQPVSPDAGGILSYLGHQGLYGYAVAAAVAELASVLVLPTLNGSNVIRVAPPLIIADEQIATALDGLDTVFAILDQRATDRFARALGMTQLRPVVVEDPVVLPPPPRPPARTGRNSFAFLGHYTCRDDVLSSDPALKRLSGDELDYFCEYMARVPPGVIVHARKVQSATGVEVDGWILGLGMLPKHMFRLGRRRVCDEIARAVDLAAGLGASVVGLGGFTTPYSGRGQSVVGRGPGITTGNALTAGMAFAAIRHIVERREMAFADLDVAIVGARGSVGSLGARLLARARPRRLWLIGNPNSGIAPLNALRDQLDLAPERIGVSADLGALAGCHVILAATGAARPVLDGAPLRRGAIICDVARPFDASPAVRARPDLTVIDGGLVASPDPRLRFGLGNLQGLPDGVHLACLSETILLAMEGDRRDHGIGDKVPLDEVDYVMGLAKRHGFDLVEPRADTPADDRCAAPSARVSA